MPVSSRKPEREKPLEDPAQLGFGKYFTDRMLTRRYRAGRGWDEPRIVPYGNLSLDPASRFMHYSQ